MCGNEGDLNRLIEKARRVIINMGGVVPNKPFESRRIKSDINLNVRLFIDCKHIKCPFRVAADRHHILNVWFQYGPVA